MACITNGIIVWVILAFAWTNSEEETCDATTKVQVREVNNAFHAALTDFAFQIYRETVNTTGDTDSIFMSPISIAIALGMLTEGAVGETKRQLVEMFNPGNSTLLNADQFKHLFHDYESTAFASNANYELSMANKIYVDYEYQPSSDFERTLSTCFKSAAERLHIMGDPEAARQQINQWVERKTEDKITNLIPTDGLSTDTVMVLVNAIYFNASWHAHFKQEETRKERFIKYGTPADNVSMMHGEFMQNEVNVYEDDYIEAIRLPYKNKQLHMLVLLPKENTREAMGRLESWLTADRVKNMTFGSDQGLEIVVQMPKFNLELDIPLKTILARMGVEHMFTDEANFERMSALKVKVSNAFHKAFIQVDEEGTEASAATAIGMYWMRSVARGPREFRANHPFMFAIVHKESGTPLFIGKYVGG